MMLDYEMIRLLGWAILVLVCIGFLVCDGVLLGVGMLLPLAVKADADRQALADGLAPVALVQQAWLFAAIGLLFAAWPTVYAVLFASLQWLLLLMLLAWIVRPLAIFFRHTLSDPVWRRYCDMAMAAGGLSIAALLGVICGNLLKGVPFHIESDMRIFFLGNVWGLLNPFAFVLAAVSVALFSFYGAGYLQMKTAHDCRGMMYKSGAAFLVLYVLAGLWIMHLEGYHINSDLFVNADSNPLNKFVKRGDGLWLDNYEHEPGLWVVPVLAIVGCVSALVLTWFERAYWAFIACVLTVVFAALTVAVSMFPFLLPSNRSLNTSLTIWDAGASRTVSMIILWVAAGAVPVMALVSRWAFGAVRVKTE